MSRLDPEKLSVEFREGVTYTKPIIPRYYTLTHSDITAKLFLTIGLTYTNDKISAKRDEVFGKWVRNKEQYFYHIYLYVDGRCNYIVTSIRDKIFRQELPLALEAIRYGDRKFFAEYPNLDNRPIMVHFISYIPQYNKIENWGTFSDYNVITEKYQGRNFFRKRI